MSPSLGEAASITCTSPDPSGALDIRAAPFQAPCVPAAPNCVAVPSLPPSAPGANATVLVNFTAVPSSNASFFSFIDCVLDSAPLATSSAAGLPYPRFGLHTWLPPLDTASFQLSLPLLAAVLRESSTFGVFTVAGGASVGSPVTLPSLDALAAACPGPLTAYAQGLNVSTASPWMSSALLFPCPFARAALEAMVASILRSPASPSLAATLSGARHLLLVASPRTPFPPAPALLVSLGGVPCTINWVFGATVASVTTPPIAALCGNVTGGACGLAPLILAFNTTSFLPLPATYPPLLPSADWSGQLAALEVGTSPPPATPLAQAASLVGLRAPLLLASAAALAPAGVGIQIVSRCIDPTYAPPEMCIVVNGTQPLLNVSAGQTCVWGTGDVCLPCPAGALCPGGALILPLPGFWCPAPSSSPGDLYPCPFPDTLQRCPGYAAISSVGGTYGCGKGFRGQVCAACAAGYFRSLGTCTTCPPFSTWALVGPVLVFGGVLCAGGVALATVVWCVLWCGGKRAGLLEAALPVGSLLTWTWIAAQGLASLFSQAQALAPPELAPIYAAAAALQFQGIALDPACYSSVPFQSFYASLGVVLGCYALSGAALYCLRRLQAPPVRRAAVALLSFSALALSLGYGALTAEFSSALVCTISAPMTVVDYLQTANDGTALLARFPALSRANFATLQAASTNPLAAAASGLTATLQASMPVSVLASDPYKVCNEAEHRVVRPLAAIMCIAFTLGLPLLQLAGLWTAGRLKGLRRTTLVQRALRGEGGAAAAGGVAAADPPRPLFDAINTALGDATLLRRSAWFGAAQKLQLALITGLIAAAKAQLPRALYVSAQFAIILASALSICVVARARLYTPTEAWKWPVVLLLNAVTATTALVNALLLVLDQRASTVRASLAWVPLALALLTVATLLGSWLRSLRQHTLAVVFQHLPPAPQQPLPPPALVPPAVEGGGGGGGGGERAGPAPRSRHPRRQRQRTLRRSSSHAAGFIGGGGGDGEEGGDGGWLAARNPLRLGASPPAPPPAPPPPTFPDFFSDASPFAIDHGAAVIKPGWRKMEGLTWEHTGTGALWTGPLPPPLPRAPLSTWRASEPRLAAADALFEGAAGVGGRATYLGGAAFQAPAVGSPTQPGDAAASLWRRTPDPPFTWVCMATGATAARDRELPTGARTADGWVLHRDAADRWWWHAERREAAWAGPWVDAERAAVRAGKARARKEARREQRRRSRER
jgi:hypothetical protein